MGLAAGDSNLYRYVNNAQTNATDPSGLSTLDVQYRLWGKTVTEYPWLGIADAEWADTGTFGVAISIADDNGPMRMTGVSSISNNTGITVGYNFKKSFWSTYGSEWDNGIINDEAGAKVLQSGENSLEIAVDFVNAMEKSRLPIRLVANLVEK